MTAEAEPLSPECRRRLIAAAERSFRVRREIILLAAHACGHPCGPERACRTCHDHWPCPDVQRTARPALDAFADTTPDPAAPSGEPKAPDVCGDCIDGKHIWSLLGECRCPGCYCTAKRAAAPSGEPNTEENPK